MEFTEALQIAWSIVSGICFIVGSLALLGGWMVIAIGILKALDVFVESWWGKAIAFIVVLVSFVGLEVLTISAILWLSPKIFS